MIIKTNIIFILNFIILIDKIEIKTNSADFFTDKNTDIMKLEKNILMVTELGKIEESSLGN